MKRLCALLMAFLMLPIGGCGQASSGQQSDTLYSEAEAQSETDGSGSDTSQQISAPVLTTEKPPENDGVVEITESMFVSQINDVYLNADDYFGKPFKYEGMFTQYTWEETGMTYYMVYRDSPGCCGNDGTAGFEVVWPEGAEQPYPNENDWCEVVGTLASYEEFGSEYLHIILDSLSVKSERGLEFVSQ